MYHTLISTQDMALNLDERDYLLVDCRFNLADVNYGRNAYEQGHIPGAVYAHLDHDLSGRKVKGETGRHPLPKTEDISQLFSSWGISKETQVVVYDDISGPFAARLWWMLRWMGHENVALLNGGLTQWKAEKRALSTSVNQPEKTKFQPVVNDRMRVDTKEVELAMDDDNIMLIDARTGDRFCGQNETLDLKAGHIPGAISSPFVNNLTETGFLKENDALLKMYSETIEGTKPENIIMYCGSGVTAAHNILAMTCCGLIGARNYTGSWSEWITDDSRPIETC